jgi:predicted HTH transcriptional regulator
MLAVCAEAGLKPPRFEEIGTNFRVILFGTRVAVPARPDWHNQLIRYLAQKGQISTQEAARLWKTSDRTARTRLRKLVTDGVLAEMGTGPKDPYRTYVLKEGYPE